MTRSVVFASLASLSLIACGGGGGDPDAGPRIDARPTTDSAPAGCGLNATYDLSLGTEEMPATFGGSFGQDMMGNWVLAVYGGLNQLEPELGNHGLTILMIDGIGMFETSPFGAVPTDEPLPIDGIDTDCGGCMIGYAGQPNSTPPQDPGNVPTQAYLPNTGDTLTFTEFGPIVDDGTTTTRIAAQYATNMTGVDYANPDTLLGCNSVVNISIVFDATFSSTAFAPTKTPKPLVASQPFVVTKR
jgi:hypothetical protein